MPPNALRGVLKVDRATIWVECSFSMTLLRSPHAVTEHTLKVSHAASSVECLFSMTLRHSPRT